MENIKEKNLLSLAIPIFFELLLIMIVGNIDTIMLGYYSDMIPIKDTYILSTN